MGQFQSSAPDPWNSRYMTEQDLIKTGTFRMTRLRTYKDGALLSRIARPPAHAA
jgi:hypothetical protein